MTLVLVGGIAPVLTPDEGQAQEGDPPEITLLSPGPDETITEPAFGIQMCFSAPVNILDQHLGGDFDFSLTPPETFPVGLRIVFQTDGYGLVVYPNNNDVETPEGEWLFTYRLTAPETLAVTEGEYTWTVDPSGEELPQATPPDCLPSGETASAGTDSTRNASATGALSTPALSGSPGSDGSIDEGDDDGPDILLLALLTIGAAAGVGVLALIGYFVRRGVGFEPHRPGSGDEPPEHH